MKVAVGDAIPPFRMERVTPERMKTVAAIFRDPTAKVGDFRDVRVTDATPNTFLAELASA